MKKKRAAPARKKTTPVAPVSAAAKPKASGGKPSMAVAIIAFLLNILLVSSGLGTILGGRVKHGLFQLLVLWLGVIVAFIGFFIAVASPIQGLIVAMLGCLMVLTGWVWAVISGVLIVRDASL